MTKKEFIEIFMLHPGINKSHFARAIGASPHSVASKMYSKKGLNDWQVDKLGEAILKFLDEIKITEVKE